MQTGSELRLGKVMLVVVVVVAYAPAALPQHGQDSGWLASWLQSLLSPSSQLPFVWEIILPNVKHFGRSSSRRNA